MAQEGARYGITVNAIAPGYVDTEMVRAVPAEVLEKIIAKIPRGRLGTAEDIARGVVFLTADDADFVTGFDALHQRRPTHVLRGILLRWPSDALFEASGARDIKYAPLRVFENHAS